MFFDHLDKMCAEHGISVSKLLEEIQISKSSASRWKSKGFLPSRPVQKKIADYFGISVFELMNNKEKPTADNGDGLMETLQDPLDLDFSKKLALLTQEQKEMIIAQMEVLIKNHSPRQ